MIPKLIMDKLPVSAWYRFLHSKESLLLQMIKYVGCGGIAVAVDQLIFYSLAWRLFPILGEADPVVVLLARIGVEAAPADEANIGSYYWIIKGVCFVAANLVVYLLNRAFVFEGGRHKQGLEMGLFFLVAASQFLWIGLGDVLIRVAGWQVTYANITSIAVGAVSNFLLRKFIIFKR